LLFIPITPQIDTYIDPCRTIGLTESIADATPHLMHPVFAGERFVIEPVVVSRDALPKVVPEPLCPVASTERRRGKIKGICFLTLG